MHRSLALLVLVATACGGGSRRSDVSMPDAYTIVRTDAESGHFLRGFPAVSPDGSLNVVVEIPMGTNALWEVDPGDGTLRRRRDGGVPQSLRYLGQVGNYGIVPRTANERQPGVPPQPLRALVLDPPALRGSIVRGRPVAVLRLVEDGHERPVLLAVGTDSAMADVRDLPELERDFPGVTDIVETWFRNRGGAGRVDSAGFGDAAEARAVLAAARESFGAP